MRKMVYEGLGIKSITTFGRFDNGILVTLEDGTKFELQIEWHKVMDTELMETKEVEDEEERDELMVLLVDEIDCNWDLIEAYKVGRIKKTMRQIPNSAKVVYEYDVINNNIFDYYK